MLLSPIARHPWSLLCLFNDIKQSHSPKLRQATDRVATFGCMPGSGQ